MKSITFYFLIRPAIVKQERNNFTIETLDEKELKYISNGKIFIVFDNPRDFIIIDTDVYDYLLQLKEVISYIENGNLETFAVSGDYYNGFLEFKYNPSTQKLKIIDGNDGLLEIEVSFKDFKTSFLKFFNQAISDLKVIYPELERNENFIKKTR